jgi:8-oxo-dGTP pyrophosphatase MutT (NUDIX family)
MTSDTSDNGSHTDSDTPIRDAACLILIDRSEPEPRLLMGRRQATQVFLPNKWVFPGGRVDDEDRALAARLSEASGAQANATTLVAFAIAALRETFEETGIVVASHMPPGDGLEAAWQVSSEGGKFPGSDGLKPLARAITPPGRPRRFDTWFFVKDWSRHRQAGGSPDGELLDLGWFTLAEVRALDLPIITRYIVDDVASVLATGGDTPSPLIPFYFQDVDGYRRTLIDASGPFLAP